ncbi:MAG: hypothetical protein K2L70_00910 [Clostridia bacterium]|nr:hypothetical protein [Clostridia bacterium]
MKLTLTNVRTIKRESYNKLTRHVCNYVISKRHDYDDKTTIFKDILYHGCVSGIVSELIYYSDTLKFYKKYKDEINSLLSEQMQSMGCFSLKDIFGKNFDDEDPLIIDTHNQNLMAWYGFEETLRNIGNIFEEVQSYI